MEAEKLANPGLPGKWMLKQCVCGACATVHVWWISILSRILQVTELTDNTVMQQRSENKTYQHCSYKKQQTSTDHRVRQLMQKEEKQCYRCSNWTV